LKNSQNILKYKKIKKLQNFPVWEINQS
jgi:hypothetical protein